MEGAHRGGRRVKGGVVGSKSEASARQKPRSVRSVVLRRRAGEGKPCRLPVQR